jgi:hypothetical protein
VKVGGVSGTTSPEFYLKERDNMIETDVSVLLH